MTKKYYYGIVFGILAAAISLSLSTMGLLDKGEHLLWDARVRMLARPSSHTKRVKIIALDGESLDWMQNEFQNSWPWPRQTYGPILAFCKRAGVRGVAFDVLFEHPSNIPMDDAALGEAIKAGPPFVSALLLSEDPSASPRWPSELASKIRPSFGLEGMAAPLRSRLQHSGARFPVPAIADAATLLGNVREDPDSDNIIRKVHPVRLYDTRAVPSLAVALAMVGEGHDIRFLHRPSPSFRTGSTTIPLGPEGETILRYRGPSGTHEKFRAAAIINSELQLMEGTTPEIDPAMLKDAYVFFGFTAAALHDLKATPLSGNCPGVEIHATVLDNVLANDFITSPPLWLMICSSVFLAIMSGTTALLIRRLWLNTFVSFLFLPIPFFVGLAAYEAGLWWPVLTEMLSVLLASILGIATNYITESKERRFLKQAFQYYLSPHVIERILEDPSKLSLGGERRELTIFFSDLEGFTSISEKLDPHDLTDLLNDYLSDMTDIILEEGGTLDKYEGDAIIAFWNAPLDQPDHALRAVRTMIRCQQKLASRRDEFRNRTGATLLMRIGMHTGTVVVGNMGSQQRFDYSMLGDAANLAARLEGANKIFHTYSMISEETYGRVAEQVVCRELGALRVVGRTTPVRVYEPLGLKGEVATDARAAFAHAMDLYRYGSFDEARALFLCLTDDPAAAVYAAKCESLAQKGVDPDWDGVWNLTAK